MCKQDLFDLKKLPRKNLGGGTEIKTLIDKTSLSLWYLSRDRLESRINRDGLCQEKLWKDGSHDVFGTDWVEWLGQFSSVCSYTPFFQPSVKSFGTERLIRTSLDLELDLQASKTWHDQLVQEISVLRELKEQLEQAQSQGEKELPQWVKDDERFRLLLRLVEKRVSNTCLGVSFHLLE